MVIGGCAGWIAGKIMKKEGSTLRNVILGLVGSVVGSLVLGLVGIQGSGLIGTLIVSVVGACIIIWVGNKLF